MQKSLFILACWLTQALADAVSNIVVFGDSYSGKNKRLFYPQDQLILQG
jgi:hypothetical protein